MLQINNPLYLIENPNLNLDVAEGFSLRLEIEMDFNNKYLNIRIGGTAVYMGLKPSFLDWNSS